jgi:hypothetical protein
MALKMADELKPICWLSWTEFVVISEKYQSEEITCEHQI